MRQRQTVQWVFLLALLAVTASAQEGLLETGKDGLAQRAWVLMDVAQFVRGEREIEVPDEALGSRSYNYVAFYVDGELVAVDEAPPFAVTFDFGSYTHKAKLLAVGVQYEIQALQAAAPGEPTEPAPDEQEEPPAEQEQDSQLTITSPTADQFVSGRTVITVESTIAARRIHRLDFFVDGRLAGQDTAPPFELMHDFGSGFNAHTIAVTAVLRDGRRVSTELQTQELDSSAYRIRTRLVTLDATVLDWRDRLVSDLTSEEFRIYEDGVRQEITHFSVEERPLRVALLIDTSGSMRYFHRMERAKEAAKRFLNYLRPEQDKVSAIAFTEGVDVLARFTNDMELVARELDGLRPQGGTAINDALDRAVPFFEDEPGRKAIILLSDGFDEHSSTSLEDAVESLRRAGIKVYTIAILENLEMLEDAMRPPPTHRGKQPSLDPEDARRQRDPLGNEVDVRKVFFIGLAEEMGGAAFFPRRGSDLDLAFDRIAVELRSQYSLAYVPSNGDYDGSWREISVETTRSGLTARTRSGYYAER